MDKGFLLDTHVVIWWRTDPQRLSERARDTIATAPLVFVSAASAWEVAIKTALGRIRLPGTFASGVRESGFTELPITFAHVEHYQALPLHHRDPFDRMLVVQARAEGLTLVTHDRRFELYDLPILWS